MNEKKNAPDREDLRATTESIRHDAERLARVEQEKGELDPSDPRVDDLSRDSQKLIAEIEQKAKAERELAEQDEDTESPASRPD